MSTSQRRIIDATLELIAQRGVSAVTMVDIARTAGVARATLYNHYADVPSILADATTRHQEQAIAGLHQHLAVADSPADTIAQLVRYVAAISGHGHTLTAHQVLPPELHHQLAAFDRELERVIRGALVDGRADGEFRSDLDLDITTRLVRHMLGGVSELVAEHPDAAAHVSRTATAAILAAITEPPSVGSSPH